MTLDPGLAELVTAFARRNGLSVEQALDDVIRRGLSAPARQDVPPRFRVQPHESGFCPGIDPSRLNELVDEIEVEDFLAEATAG